MSRIRLKTSRKSMLRTFLIFSMIILFTKCQDQTLQAHEVIKQPQLNQDVETMFTKIDFQGQAQQNLNYEIQQLDPEFTKKFLDRYHISKSVLSSAVSDQSLAPELNISTIKSQPGTFLMLLGKMYLYDTLPKSSFTGKPWPMYSSEARYLLAYFYLKIAAQRYQSAEAYYYLAVLDYYKLNPHQTVISNLEKQIDSITKEEGYAKVYEKKYYELLEYLKEQRFVGVEHNLFLSSMLGNPGASLMMGNMLKEGLGMEKNCTSALAYYFSVIKESIVDTYEFRHGYSDETSFQKELYSKKRAQFENEQSADVVEGSQFFDSETIKAVFQLAEKYFIGRGGYKKNYVKAAELYGKLAAHDHKNSMAMLGMCYFKGQGVPLDRKRARVLFQNSNKVSISQAMLLVMDYFEIQSKGNRAYAIKKMKQIYDKKKENMHSIIKFLLATIALKGDVPEIKTDDAVLLLGTAANEGHLMAKIAMGLLFSDGIDVNYDCTRAINYFSQEAISHPFFMDKYYMARLALKEGKTTFALLKYLELSILGNTNSFINAMYILEIEKQKSLGFTQKSWDIEVASLDSLYNTLKSARIVPDIHSYFIKQYSFMGQRPLKTSNLNVWLSYNQIAEQSHFQYLKKKLVKVCAITKENSLMQFYEYKMSGKEDATLLNTISNGEAEKLHVLESRYLLGQYYHKRAFEAIELGKDHTKEQYKALQQYKRATSSPIIGKILFYIQQIRLNPYGVDFQNELFQFGFMNDLLTYTFVLSIVMFILYYKRSKKLDEIHKKELEKRHEEKRIQEEEEEFKRKFSEDSQSSNRITSARPFEEEKQFEMARQKDANQPEIFEERQSQGYRIGGTEQQIPEVLRQVYSYEQYKPQQTEQETQKKKENQQTNNDQAHLKTQ